MNALNCNCECSGCIVCLWSLGNFFLSLFFISNVKLTCFRLVCLVSVSNVKLVVYMMRECSISVSSVCLLLISCYGIANSPGLIL